jgi:tetratricopeptide (TPR) repeat protein
MAVGLLLLGCAPSVGELRDEAVSQYQLGHSKQAELTFREVLDKRPYDAESLYYMGRILHGQGRLAQAIYYYQCCLDVDPSYETARLWLRRAQEQAGDMGEDLRFLPREVTEGTR